MVCWCFSTKKYSLRIYLYIFKDIFRIKNAFSITFEHRVSLDYQTKRETFLETRINENNMLVEKMHICFKKCYCLNLVLSKWVMWHDTFWGRLQNRKNRRNGDGRLVLEVTYFIVIWQKGGNELLKIGNWKYQNFEWLRKTLISIFLSPPILSKVERKNTVALAQKEGDWQLEYYFGGVRTCSGCSPVALFEGTSFWNKDRIVTDLRVAITDRVGATESTFENYCVLTKSFLGKETTI